MELLGTAVKMLASIGAKPAIEKAKRTQAVVSVLHRLGFMPASPPPNFDGVYVFSVVEYCYGRDAPVLRFFESEVIKDVFRTAFSLATRPTSGEKRDMLSIGMKKLANSGVRTTTLGENSRGSRRSLIGL